MSDPNEELDDAWDPSPKKDAGPPSPDADEPEGPNSKRATIRAPAPAVSPSQPPTVRPSQSQVDADELKPSEPVVKE